MEVTPTFDDEVLRITQTTDPPSLHLEGELDATQHSVFSEALSAMLVENSEVRLDCSRLSFIDLGALSLLTSCAADHGAGTRLVLDNLSPGVENLIETVGWERLPGLVQGRKGTS